MKKLILLTTVITFALIFNACGKDDETTKPSINNLEIGHDNSKIGYAGSDFHIEAEIHAPGRIDRIVIEIHYTDSHDYKNEYKNGDHDNEWEFKKTYTDYSGLKNTRFHKHIDIPEDIKTGDYHFHFKVVDEEGYTEEIHEDIEIKGNE